MGFALGVKTSIYNDELRSRRLERGITQVQLAKYVGVQAQVIGRIETFKDYPKQSVLEDIADFLESDIETMFPEWLRNQKLKKSSKTFTTYVDYIALDDGVVNSIESGIDVEEEIDKTYLADVLNKSMNGLTEREQRILNMRYGLNGFEAKNLKEVAEEFSVTRARIQAIEQKALSKIRKNDKIKTLYTMYKESA